MPIIIILSIVAVALFTLYPGSVGLTTDSLAPYLTHQVAIEIAMKYIFQPNHYPND